MLDTRQIHSLSDFVRNPKAHVARMKQTHIPEVLTINGRAELVVLDTETIISLRASIADARKTSLPRETLSLDVSNYEQIELPPLRPARYSFLQVSGELYERVFSQLIDIIAYA